MVPSYGAFPCVGGSPAVCDDVIFVIARKRNVMLWYHKSTNCTVNMIYENMIVTDDTTLVHTDYISGCV